LEPIEDPSLPPDLVGRLGEPMRRLSIAAKRAPDHLRHLADLDQDAPRGLLLLGGARKPTSQ
jgi:hypothetical protein